MLRSELGKLAAGRIAEDLLSGERQLATRGRLVLVALGPQGEPVNIPPLSLDAGVVD